MCTAKAPKQQVVEEKEVQHLSNPWVDGLGIVGSQSRGRNSLRTDLRRNPRRSNSGYVLPTLPGLGLPGRPIPAPGGGRRPGEAPPKGGGYNTDMGAIQVR